MSLHLTKKFLATHTVKHKVGGYAYVTNERCCFKQIRHFAYCIPVRDIWKQTHNMQLQLLNLLK